MIETFIEVPFELKGANCRPDGLIRVRRGQRTWTALVEVKTGRNDLEAAQVTTYLDVARKHGTTVTTISHQVATTPGVHPVTVDRRKTLQGRSRAPVVGRRLTPRRRFSMQTTRSPIPTRLGFSLSSSDTSRTRNPAHSTSTTWGRHG